MPTLTDWCTVYAELDGNSPVPVQRISTLSTVAVKADLLIGLNDWLTQCKAVPKPPSVISVYADVLQIREPVALDLGTTTLELCARRIEVTDNATITLTASPGQTGKLVVFCQEVGGHLQATVQFKGPNAPINQTFDLTDRTTFGSIVSAAKGPELTPRTSFSDSGLDYGDPLRIHAVTILQYGIAAFYSHPDLARSMVSYVQRLTYGSTQAPDLYMQASAVLTNLFANASPVTCVPCLDRTVYEGTVQAYVTAAAAYETQYQRFTDLSTSAANRLAAANNMLDHNSDLIGMNTKLIAQAQGNLDKAQSASTTADASLQIANMDLKNAATAFKYDVKIWTREQVIKAVFEICGAIVQMGLSVGAMCVGDEAAAPGAARAAANGAKAAADAGEAAQGAADAVEIARKASSTAAELKKIGKFVENLSKILEALNKIIAAAGDISTARDMPDASLPPTGDLSADPGWDIFALQVEAMLKPAIDADIPGAEDYVVAVRSFALYGKAATAAKVAIVNFAQQVVQLKLQQQVNANQAARLRELVKDIARQEANYEEMKQLFFQWELNMRFWVFTAFQSYAWAYRYWALRDSSVRPSIVKTVAQLQQDLATVSREYADALASFNPPPQVLTQSITVTSGDDGLFKGLVEQLRATGTTTIPIPLTELQFDGLDRVRLTTVRVWLLGVASSMSTPINLNVDTSGFYEDRFQGRKFQFSTDTLRYAFRYRGAPGEIAGIVVDGRVEDSSRYLYFQPTPFTQWTISLVKPADTKLLSSLTGIQFDFCGSVNAETAA
jgi:hypothetical protein